MMDGDTNRDSDQQRIDDQRGGDAGAHLEDREEEGFRPCGDPAEAAACGCSVHRYHCNLLAIDDLLHAHPPSCTEIRG
jgi:hypothetical protein